MRSIPTIAIPVALALLAAGCGGSSTAGDHPGDRASATAKPSTGTPGDRLPQGSEPAELDPRNFTTEIDNPYWPMTPGSRWVYPRDRHRGLEGEGRRGGHPRDQEDRQRRRGSGG